MIQPSRELFLETLKTSGVLPLWEEVPFESPFDVYRAFCNPQSFILESVKGPEKIARYSIVGFRPCLILKTKDAVNEILGPGIEIKRYGSPMTIMRALLSSYNQVPVDYLPPFQGGLCGMLSYDFVQYLEEVPHAAEDDLLLPDAHLFVVDKLIAFDHLLKKSWIICCPGVESSIISRPNIDWEQEYEGAQCRIAWMKKVLDEGLRRCVPDRPLSPGALEIKYEMKKNDYKDMVRKAKEYIAAGDIFQANLSQRAGAFIGGRSPLDLYSRLRTINPSPFACFLDFGGYHIVSSSPERLVRLRNGIVDTRPIAGTRPRGRNKREDDQMRVELILNEKERAEHIMLIDLERNDLGRVSNYGTVMADELLITEDYSHVIHIVSNITGELAAGKDCLSVLEAVFPGGTITGVPKVRCMQIIDELERVRRGPYTGSIGYLGFNGNMDLNITIRSFVIKGDMAYVQAGAGIVADSDPEHEYCETLKKAEALIKTLECN